MVYVATEKKKLEDIIDHLHGNVHKAAVEQKTHSEQWKEKDANHPWLTVVRKTNKVVLET